MSKITNDDLAQDAL